MAKKKKKKGSVGKVLLVIFLFLLIIIGALAAAAYTIWRSYYNKSNYVNDTDFSVYYEIPDEGELESETVDEELVMQVEVDIKDAIDDHEIQDADYVYNVLLIGSDRRNGSWYGNSDTMILVSVNTKTKKFYMTSFMRDLYAVIPGIGVKKLNAAHAHGAGPLLVQTIEDNFKVDIDNWASVDFSSMQTIIDSLGGINMELYQAEADYLNGVFGNKFAPGVVHFNGAEALEFARIRKIGQYDYERTSRQRRVLEQMISQMRGLSVGQLNNFVNAVLPLVTHNVSEGDLVSKIASLPEWINYQVVQDRIPYDGMYGHQGEMLVPDYDATITRLKSTIYATE